MATRQDEALAMVARVRRVGWDVEQVPDGWRVTCPDKRIVNVHLTPSDVNHLRTIGRALNRSGFAEAEQARLEREEAERQAALAADRERNERRAEKTAKRASALALAAGPYGPARITVDEILAVHPAPLVYHRVLVTPEMAAAILERNKPRAGAEWPNRKVRASDVTEWTDVLRGGRWRYTHQGAALDVDGRLQDGQHRLTAIKAAGIAAEMMISVGMPRDNYAVVDSGRRRTAAQVIAAHGATYAAAIAAAARLIYIYELWGAAALDHGRDRLANDVIADVYAKLDGDDILASVRWAYTLRAEVGCGLAGPTAGMYLIRRAVPAHDPSLVEFADGTVHGVSETDSPAIYALRRQMTRQASGLVRKLTPAQQVALVVKGWNGHVQHWRGTTITVRSDSAMPQVVVPRRPEAS